MSVTVYTARLGYRGDDWLDVSLQGNMSRKGPTTTGSEPQRRGLGILFAPSPELLYPYLSKRRWGRETEGTWREYRAKYTAEMRASFRRYRAAWNVVLELPQVTLLCFCRDPSRCHRTVLGEILAKLGATFNGERGT